MTERNVVVLSWVSFFQDAASELVYPVLPPFLIALVLALLLDPLLDRMQRWGVPRSVAVASGSLTRQLRGRARMSLRPFGSSRSGRPPRGPVPRARLAEPRLARALRRLRSDRRDRQ